MVAGTTGSEAKLGVGVGEMLQVASLEPCGHSVTRDATCRGVSGAGFESWNTLTKTRIGPVFS